MSEITKISADDLRDMEGKEGLILQGCGEPYQEWLDGINEMLTEAGILKDGSKFERVMAFKHDDHTNLLFPFDENIKLEMGKLAMWRITTHEVFGGTWLSDYVPNRLGGFRAEQEPPRARPKMQLAGMDGNIFAITGRASALLKRSGQRDEAQEMFDRVIASGSYEEALGIVSEYVETELSDAVDRTRAKGPHKKSRHTPER